MLVFPFMYDLQLLSLLLCARAQAANILVLSYCAVDRIRDIPVPPADLGTRSVTGVVCVLIVSLLCTREAERGKELFRISSRKPSPLNTPLALFIALAVTTFSRVGHEVFDNWEGIRRIILAVSLDWELSSANRQVTYISLFTPHENQWFTMRFTIRVSRMRRTRVLPAAQYVSA